MLLAALALLLAAQDVRAPVREHGAGLVVMLGGGHDGDMPELNGPWGGFVSISALKQLPEDLDQSGRFDIHTFELVPEVFRAADDPTIASAVRSTRRVWLTSGRLRDWFTELYPAHRESELIHALRDAHESGAVIIGRDDAAKLLARATVVADETELGRIEHNPREVGRSRVAWGLGLEPRWIVDMQSLTSPANLARLVDGMLAEQLQLGVWIDKFAAVVGDERAGSLTCRGKGYVIVIDLRRARRVQRRLLDAHISVLRDGDVWLERTRAIDEGAGREARGFSDAMVERESTDAFDTSELIAALEASTSEPPRTIVLRDERRVVTLELDSEARVLPRAEPGVAAWSRVRLGVDFAP